MGQAGLEQLSEIIMNKSCLGKVNHNLLKTFAFLVCVCGFTGAQGVTVDYLNIGTFQTTELDQGGITVTGSSTVSVLNLNGLGIVGGSSDDSVDGLEVIEFSFNSGSALNLSYFIDNADDTNFDDVFGERTLEAFGVGGASLGEIRQTDIGDFPVSALFSNVPIERFTLTSFIVDRFRVGSVTYSAVPIPPALWLFGSGLLGLIGISRRKKA
jgi:hypothetical protein